MVAFHNEHEFRDHLCEKLACRVLRAGLRPPLTLVEVVSSGRHPVTLPRFLPVPTILVRVRVDHACGGSRASRAAIAGHIALPRLAAIAGTVLVVDHQAESRAKLGAVLRELRRLGVESARTAVLLDVFDRCRHPDVHLDFVGSSVLSNALRDLPAWAVN